MCSCKAGPMGQDCLTCNLSNRIVQDLRLHIIQRESNIILMPTQDNYVIYFISYIQHTTIIDTLYPLECAQFYVENCKYLCSGQCINRTCGRFNGKNCFCGCKLKVNYIHVIKLLHLLCYYIID